MLLHIILILAVFADDDDRVRMVIELANHGARGLLYTQFNTTATAWNENMTKGEPTNTGMREQYLLGRTLRETFMHKAEIMKEKYDDFQLTVKAAPFVSPIVSAISQLMGMYTPGVGDVLTEMEQGIAIPPVEDPSILEKHMKDDLRDMGMPYYAQVFPVKTSEGAPDFLFQPLMTCNVVQELIYNMSQEETWKQLNDKYNASLFVPLQKVLNYDFNLTSATMLYDDIECDFYENKPLKIGLDINLIFDLQPVVVDFWKNFIFANQKIRFIAMTYMFEEWISYMNSAVNSDNNMMKVDKTMNFALYMGSTYNLIPFLVTIGYNIEYPIGYSANIIILFGKTMDSLNKSSGLTLEDYEVYVKLNGSVVPSVFGETNGIRADKFVQKLKENSYLNLTKTQFTDMCNTLTPKPSPNPAPEEKNHKKLIIGLSVGGGALLLIIGVGVAWTIIKKRRQSGKDQTSYTAVEEPAKESGVNQNTL